MLTYSGSLAWFLNACETFGSYQYPIKSSQTQVRSRVFELFHNNFVDEGQQETCIKQLRDFSSSLWSWQGL